MLTQTWRLAYSSVSYGTVDYVVVLTVPQDEVQAAAVAIQAAIKAAVGGMIAAFVIVMLVFIAGVAYFSLQVVNAIVDPIVKLSDILALVQQDDLRSDVPREASSYDMSTLLRAFVDFMVALRAASELYGKGDRYKAKLAYEQALELYTTSGAQYL